MNRIKQCVNADIWDTLLHIVDILMSHYLVNIGLCDM